MYTCLTLRLSPCWYSQSREDHTVHTDGGYDKEATLESKGHVKIDIEWRETDHAYPRPRQTHAVRQGQHLQEVSPQYHDGREGD